MKGPSCCYIGPVSQVLIRLGLPWHLHCPRRATWTLWNGQEPFYDYYTESCDRHVGRLLDDSPETHVYPILVIPGAYQGEVTER